jgi:hypothetical protein
LPAQQPQAEMLGEQLIEGQSPSTTASDGFRVLRIRSRRWPVDRAQRLVKRRKAVSGENVRV